MDRLDILLQLINVPVSRAISKQLINVLDDSTESVVNPPNPPPVRDRSEWAPGTASAFPDSGFPFRGVNDGKVTIRTVTHYYTGQVTRVADGFVYLDKAAWIPDTGRWSTFIEKGTPNEVEPAGCIAVNIGSIVDVVSWNHELPTKVK